MMWFTVVGGRSWWLEARAVEWFLLLQRLVMSPFKFRVGVSLKGFTSEGQCYC